jgi:NitT/TauT family transport system substrate-binding protein
LNEGFKEVGMKLFCFKSTHGWHWGIWMMVMAVLISTAPAAAGDIPKINYRLKWLFNTSVVGDLYADVQGYFSDRGLAVTVKPGGPERNAIKELELGQAQFGVASADQVIRALDKGSPVVVLAQLFQVNPLQWIYRASKRPINRLQDLEGRIIGITYGGNDETIMRTLLAKGNLAEKDVTLFSVRYDYTPFYQDKVDIWPVYRNAQGIILAEKLKQSSEAVKFLVPADFGVRFVANSVVTSEKMLREQPEVVKRFMAALMKGWRKAMDPVNRNIALDILGRFDKDTSPAMLGQQFDTTVSLVKPLPDTEIGKIDADAWRQTEQIMLDQQQIKQPVRVVDVLKPMHTP